MLSRIWEAKTTFLFYFNELTTINREIKDLTFNWYFIYETITVNHGNTIPANMKNEK